jgi:hypothetical protein
MSEDQAEESFDEFIESITEDVLRVLSSQGFFCKIEGRVWPDGPDGRKVCDGSFANAVDIATADGHSLEDQDDIFHVMRSRGGFCDCEIVLNVAPESAVRERYWKKKAAAPLDAKDQ